MFSTAVFSKYTAELRITPLVLRKTLSELRKLKVQKKSRVRSRLEKSTALLDCAS